MSTEATGAIDVGAVIDHGEVHGWHLGLFALCAACMIMDGFDVQALGYVAPAIIREWHIAPALLTPVFAASNFGVLFGQLLFTMLADKVGRRPVLIGGTLAFSLLVIATGFSRTLTELLLMRFIAGLALGSIIPNATALVGEFSPARVRIRFVTYIGIGFTLGAAFGGFVAALLIPTFGWPSVFFVGGVAPLIVAGALALWLPESLQLLALSGKRRDYIAKWLKKIDPGIAVGASTPLVVKEEHKQGVPVGHLFGARTPVTILLWLVFFLNLFNLYALANWLPTVVRAAGYDTRTAVLVGTMLQVGGTFSPFLLAWLVGRHGFIPVLATGFVIAAIAIALIGQPGFALPALVVIVTIAGACVVGAQPALNTLAAMYYPTYLRSTGLGWALGIGRAGSIVGPVVTGVFQAWTWTPQQIFLALAAPAAVSALCIVALGAALHGNASAPAERASAAM